MYATSARERNKPTSALTSTRSEMMSRERTVEMANKQLDTVRLVQSAKLMAKMNDQMKKSIQLLHMMRKEANRMEDVKFNAKGSGKRWERMIRENPVKSILHTRFKRLPEPISCQTWTQRSFSEGRSRSGKRSTKRSRQKSKSTSSRSTSRSRNLKIILRKPHVKTRRFLSARPYKPRRAVSNYGQLSADRRPKTSSVPHSSGSAVVGNATLGQFTRSYVELGIRAGVERKPINSPRIGTLTGRTSATGSIVQSGSSALERGSAGGSHIHQLRRMRYITDLRTQSLELDERVAKFCEEIVSFVNACREETNGSVQTGRDIIFDSAFAVSMLLA